VNDLATNPQGGDAVAAPLSNGASPPGDGLPAELASVTDGETSENESDSANAAAAETEEVEHEGQKYRVPKALKGAFLMQADYTRKTQEVAEQRRALEQRQNLFQQQSDMQAAHLQDVAHLVALNNQLSALEAIDWAGLRSANPEHAQDAWLRYMQLKDGRDKAAQQLQQKINQRALESQRLVAKRLEESRAMLSREIKDWSSDTAGKMSEFGIKEFGFSPAELGSVTDPRLIKLLHRAYLGDQAIRQAAASQRLANQEGVKPVPQVGSKASVGGNKPTDRQSTDEWMRARNQELRKTGLRS